LHASPFHGFSVEFSEHRKYTSGDDPKDIDWLVYAKTDKYYVKKYEAETNITGYLAMDLSRSMGYTYRQDLTKFDYAICLAAALCYLMIYQQDPCGLITFDERVRDVWLTIYRNSKQHFDLYELAEELVDVEDWFQQWRFRHMKTVERIIGLKKGTGGSAGVGFLRTALERSFFPELWDLRTLL